VTASVLDHSFRAVFRQFVLLFRRLDLYGRELLAVSGARIKHIATP
jgi:transposase